MDSSTKGIMATTFGILSAIFFMEVVGKNTNTKENRQTSFNLLNDHLNITGFRTLQGWLSEDGFIDGIYKQPQNINNDTKLTIGDGSGKTELGLRETVDNWLRNLTASGLSSLANKAIRGTPQADTIADRQKVMSWLGAEQGTVKNFDALYKDLNLVGWTTKTPQIPTGSNIPISLLLGSKTRIYDYHKFLIHSDTQELLKTIDELVDSDDRTLEARQIAYLLVLEASEAIPQPIPGFQELGNLLKLSGFIASPQTNKIPASIPDSLIIGGTTYTKVQITSILQKATSSSINKLAELALTNFDPTLKPRLEALALLKLNMDNYAVNGTSYQTVLLPDMYVWLKTSGFTSHPRKYTPVDTSKFKGTVYSYGWTEIPDISTFLLSGTADAVNELAQTGSKTGLPYTKYLSVTTGRNVPLQKTVYLGSAAGGQQNQYQFFVDQWNLMRDNGMLLHPPKQTGRVPNFKYIAGGNDWMNPFVQDEQTIYAVSSGNNLWSGQPSANELCPNIFIGSDPNIHPQGMFIKTLTNGQPNIYYNEAAYSLALVLHKKGQPILLPQ